MAELEIRGMIENYLADIKNYWSRVNSSKGSKAPLKDKKAKLKIVKAERHPHKDL